LLHNNPISELVNKKSRGTSLSGFLVTDQSVFCFLYSLRFHAGQLQGLLRGATGPPQTRHRACARNGYLGLGLARTSYARLPVALPRCARSCSPASIGDIPLTH